MSPESILKKAKAPGCLFKGARLAHANFAYAELAGASFEGADLEGANMHGVMAKDAEFKMANLKKIKETDLDRYHAETWRPPPLPPHSPEAASAR